MALSMLAGFEWTSMDDSGGRRGLRPIECLKRVDPCRHLYGCIACVGDKREDLILGFVAWIDVSGNLLLEGLIEASNEVICLRMVWGLKHLLDT